MENFRGWVALKSPITRYHCGLKIHLMKYIVLFTLLSGIATGVSGQFYFKDILSTQAANLRFANFKKQKVKDIQFKSFDADGNPIEGFSSDQQFSKDYSKVSTSTTTSLTGSTLSTSYYNPQSRLIRTVDTSDGSHTEVNYEYAADGQISVIRNTTTSAGNFSISEEHIWSYNATGKPTRMLKIKNNKDTTIVEFVLDANGNVEEEKSSFKGAALPSVYYYYNEDKQLTDIVRYNRAAKRLLPDYIFEYDENNRLGSQLVVPEGTSNYQKWYYSYDEDGLKIQDACYSKEKTLIGRVEYHYSYYQ